MARIRLDIVESTRSELKLELHHMVSGWRDSRLCSWLKYRGDGNNSSKCIIEQKSWTRSPSKRRQPYCSTLLIQIEALYIYSTFMFAEGEDANDVQMVLGKFKEYTLSHKGTPLSKDTEFGRGSTKTKKVLTSGLPTFESKPSHVSLATIGISQLLRYKIVFAIGDS